MKRILLLVTILILYGSLYPWQFHAKTLRAGPVWMLLHAWPIPFHRTDAVDAAINVPLYVPFGIFCFLAMSDAWPRALRASLTLLGAVTLSTCVELAQLFDSGRVTSLYDVVCNTIGAAIGIGFAGSFPLAITGAISEIESAGAFRPTSALALLYLWAGAELFPFIPSLRLSVLRGKLTGLLHPHTWAVRGGFESFAGWLALAFLVEGLTGRPKAVRLVPMALLVIPLKLLIASLSTTGYEVLGACCAIAAWALLGPSSSARGIAGILSLIALVAAGLAPFRFASLPQHFTWIPFLPLLQAPWESAFQILLEKSFLYGTAIWLLRQGGCAWLGSTLIVAIPLALVEAAQIYLPGHTAEITDPLLAMMLGASLMLLDRLEPKSATEALLA